MKIHAECIPCLLRRVLFETNLSTTDKNLQTTIMKTACGILSRIYNPNRSSAEIATVVHSKVYTLLGDEDPYKKLKDQSNKTALTLLPKVERLIDESNDPLKTSILCSIIGNTLDFGIEGGSTHPKLLEENFDSMLKEGLGYDDTDTLKDLLLESSEILFFADNCGEIVFDKLLLQEIKEFNPKLHITLVVKGEPILSDATMEDAEKIGFREVVDEILTTGCFAVGVNFSCIPDELSNHLKNCDLIICKGMANYESFSETSYRPIIYLLRTKCKPIASSMGLPRGINAVKAFLT